MTEASVRSEWERVWDDDALDKPTTGMSILIASSVVCTVVATTWYFRTWPSRNHDRFMPSAADILVRPPPPR